MWYDKISKTEFLKNIYTNIPEISDVTIYEIKIYDCGDRILISFRMEDIIDNVPVKWKIKGYNIPIVYLELFGIKNISMETQSNFYKASITIETDSEGLILVKVIGNLNAEILAEAGLIQSIEGESKN